MHRQNRRHAHGIASHPEQWARPGVVGTARSRKTSTNPARIEPGDIVVIDILDLSRATADALVSANIARVVNAAHPSPAGYPNLGPEVLVGNGIVLIDDAARRSSSEDQGRREDPSARRWRLRR